MRRSGRRLQQFEVHHGVDELVVSPQQPVCRGILPKNQVLRFEIEHHVVVAEQFILGPMGQLSHLIIAQQTKLMHLPAIVALNPAKEQQVIPMDVQRDALLRRLLSLVPVLGQVM